MRSTAVVNIVEDLLPEELVAMERKAKADKEPTPAEEKNTLLGKFKKKVFSTDTLLKFGTFRFNFTVDGFGTNHIFYLEKFFLEHEIKFYDFECNVREPYGFNKMHGQRLAIVEGVYFFMNKIEQDVTRRSSLVVYVPIWQREQAKTILQREMLKHRPARMLYNTSNDYVGEPYTVDLQDMEQFVRPDVLEYVLSIFRRMIENKDYYRKSGKRYKETFLLHGAPGTGKTNLFMHCLAHFDMNVYSCTPRSFVNMVDYIRKQAKQDTRFPVVVLIEDIDSCEELLLQQYKTKITSDSPMINDSEFSYSTFINAVDGAERLDNVILCMSTNHKEKLISSIYRQGRVDHQLDMLPLTSKEISERVNTEHSEYIASFPDNTFAIANIIDLRYCKTKEDIDKLIAWIKG